MDSSEIRFKYKNRGKRFRMAGEKNQEKVTENIEKAKEGRKSILRYGGGRRDNKAANYEDFMVRQVTKHEILVRDIDEGKIR